MILILSPSRGLPGHPETALSVAGDVLTVDGIAFDLAQVPEGGEATASGEHPFAGPIRRQGGVLQVPVRVLLDDSAAPHQPADPAHWTIRAGDGAVTLPALRHPTEVEE
jgi:hypothetical protein